MAKTQLTKNTTTGNWELTETNQGQTYTNTLLTDNQNISGDIEISITAKTGTQGTPVATKGTVSGNKVTITPKVTNTEGYIAGGTKLGTAITVTASELVSGSKAISANGTSVDVTNYKYVDVAVPTGITPTGNITITKQSATDVTQYATADVRAGSAAINNVSVSATVSSLSVAYDSTNTRFNVTGSSVNTGAISANVSTAGWISSVTGATATANATVSATLPRVALGADITNGGARRPTISRTAKPSADTWTDAANGSATTTKPTSGVYVQVNSAANTVTLTAAAKVSTAGYGTTAQYGVTNATTTVGASASSNTYIPIKTGSVTQPTATVTTNTDANPNYDDGYLYVQAEVTPSVSPGWISTGTSGTVYIKAPMNYENVEITPTSSTQTYNPPSGKIVNQVIVNPVTEETLCNLSRNLSASSSAVYYAGGPVVINIAVGSTIVGTKAILKETYFMIYSLSVSGTTATLTYRVPKIESTSGLEWNSYTLTATVPSGASPTCKVKYSSGNLCACSSSAITYSQYGKNKSSVSWSGDMTLNVILHNVPPLIEIYCYASHSSAGSGSATRYITAKYCQITSISTSTNSSGYSSSTSIQYKYSNDGVNWTSGTCSVAKGGSSSGTISSYCYIYFRNFRIQTVYID